MIGEDDTDRDVFSRCIRRRPMIFGRMNCFRLVLNIMVIAFDEFGWKDDFSDSTLDEELKTGRIRKRKRMKRKRKKEEEEDDDDLADFASSEDDDDDFTDFE